MLMSLAATQLPQFGVNPGSIRDAFLNSTTVTSTLINNTNENATTAVQLISIQFTVIIVRRLLVDPKWRKTHLFFLMHRVQGSSQQVSSRRRSMASFVGDNSTFAGQPHQSDRPSKHNVQGAVRVAMHAYSEFLSSRSFMREMTTPFTILLDAMARFGPEEGYDNVYLHGRLSPRRRGLIASTAADGGNVFSTLTIPQTTGAIASGGQPGGTIVSAQAPTSTALTKTPSATDIMMSALTASVASIQTSITAMEVNVVHSNDERNVIQLTTIVNTGFPGGHDCCRDPTRCYV